MLVGVICPEAAVPMLAVQLHLLRVPLAAVSDANPAMPVEAGENSAEWSALEAVVKGNGLGSVILLGFVL